MGEYRFTSLSKLLVFLNVAKATYTIKTTKIKRLDCIWRLSIA
jgi:hypothetical protein